MSRGRKPITQCTPGEWRTVVNELKACCPAPEGFEWRIMWCRGLGDKDSEDTGGYEIRAPVGSKRGTIYIRIVKGLSRMETIDTLIHELAHAYDVTCSPHHGWASDHSDTFWIWVGRIYRRWHGE